MSRAAQRDDEENGSLWPPALQYRDFRLFWFGQMVSLIGTFVQQVAQQWLVLQLTGSAFKLGLVSTVQFTPMLLLALPSGAIVDRVSKRNLLMATQVASGLLAVTLAVLVQTHTVRFWHVLVIAGLLGTVNAFYVPARQAFVPELVDRSVLGNAIALNSTIFNAARVVGPSLGGLLIASIGLALNFYLNALSYVAVLIGLLLIRPAHAVAPQSGRALWKQVHEGLAYIAETPTVLTILALIGVASLFAMNMNILLPIFAQHVLHVGSAGYGLLSGSLGLGSLTGALLLTVFNRRDWARPLIYIGASVFCLAQIAFALSHVYGVSLALLVLVGLFTTLFTTTANTRVLSQTPSELQGRVMSVYTMMFLGVTPFGALFAGGIAERYGAPVAVIAGAAVTFVFTVIVFFIRRTHRVRQTQMATDPG